MSQHNSYPTGGIDYPRTLQEFDKWFSTENACNELEKYGYIHKQVKLSDSGDPAHVVMPGVHRISSLLKRWILGTHQGSISAKHIDYYLDEYTFRFNRRTSNARGLLFYRLLQQSVLVPPVTYKEITRGQQ